MQTLQPLAGARLQYTSKICVRETRSSNYLAMVGFYLLLCGKSTFSQGFCLTIEVKFDAKKSIVGAYVLVLVVNCLLEESRSSDIAIRRTL